jgi:RNA polymerase sigma factor (sigma-70 family)
MVSGSAHAEVPDPLQTLFRFGVVGDLSDGQLVQRFVAARDGADQAAFTALVERHGPMVLGVCRKVLGDPHDAQDAFQATFLILARKAGSVRKADSLGSWLHGVALRVARRARVQAGRRRVHELRCAATKAAEPERAGSSPEGWPELHEEIARLPGRYREPVVLCYLEGLSTDAAAIRIGCPKGTILSRLSRAREQLRGRLVRRGVAPSADSLATGPIPRAMAPLPAGLLNATVRASLGFAGRCATEAASAPVALTSLARRVLQTMTISELKILVAMALACGFVWGGVRTFGQAHGLSESQRPVGTVPDAGETQDAPTRAVDKPQSDVDESAQRTAAMPIAQQLNAAAAAAENLVEQLRRHPTQPSTADGQFGLYVIDVSGGEVTRAASEPEPGICQCGSGAWSRDGKRIYFDATTGDSDDMRHHRTRLKVLELEGGRPRVTDLGHGNCPTPSPASDQVIFLMNPSNAAGARPGLWIMNSDGTDRRWLDGDGRPLWSYERHQLLVVTFTEPREVTLIDGWPDRKSGLLQVRGRKFFSAPSWAGERIIVAVTGGEAGDAVVLIDVSNPEEATVTETLWKRGQDLDIKPLSPVYSPETKTCVFVGEQEGKGLALYSIRRGQPGPPRRLEAEGFDNVLRSLSFAPGGRYVAFSSDRPDRRKAVNPPAVRRP